MNLEGIAITRLCRELDEKLAGSRIERIFQQDKHTFTLRIRGFGESFRLIISLHPEKPCLYFSAVNIENPEMPPAFCMLLRKHFENGKIAAVSQLGFDRVICINVDIRGEKNLIETKQLYIELMGKKSNMIFVRDNVVVDAARRINGTDNRYRQILPGIPYICPPQQNKTALQNITEAEIEVLPDIPLSKALVQRIGGIGPQTAAYLCENSGLPQELPAGKLEASDRAELLETIQQTSKSINTAPATATVIFCGKQLLQIAPYQLNAADCESQDFEHFTAAIAFAAQLSGKQPGFPEKDAFAGRVRNEINRAENKFKLLSQELASCELAEKYKLYGDILLTYGFMINGRPGKVKLPDLYNEGNTVEIPLDSRHDAAGNARACYNRYNKLQRAEKHITAQMNLTKSNIAYLESIAASINIADNRSDLEQIELEFAEAGYAKIMPAKKKFAKANDNKPLQFSSPGGLTVYVGKNNKQNDYVTFKLAAANDLWFHSKDIPGSHVIIKCNVQKPENADIEFAAALAARYSKAGESSKVAVDYTIRKQVKKPSGAKPGFVIYFDQKTIMVEPAK